LENYENLRVIGFSIVSLDQLHFVKAVRDNVEIHLQENEQDYFLKIPIAKVPSWGLPPSLCEYLGERTLNHKGPGRFVAESRYIWYMVDNVPKDNLPEIAVKMQETVEKIGPKILNQMK
jgi:hypothetical protein